MKVCEIFSSIQGESSYAGLPCTFVRLTGCNMRCAYCDTEYSFSGGTELSVSGVLERVRSFGVGLVEVTGGEPLLQAETPELISRLLEEGYNVLVETNGSVSIREIDCRAVIVLDIKTPGSGMSSANDLSNLAYIKPSDEIKFVLCGRQDYIWAKEFITSHRLTDRCGILFSPVTSLLEPASLARWIVEDRLDVRLNIQIHKVIFGPDARGV